MIQMYNRPFLQTLTNITLERWLETILTLLSSAQKLSRFFFLPKGFPLISRVIASYVGASDIGHSI